MNDIPYGYKECKDLGMAIIADAFRSILNEEEDSKLSERFLLTSSVAELILHEIGVTPGDIPVVLEKLKASGAKMWGRFSLTDEESYQIHKQNMSEARMGRKSEKQRKRWVKNVSTTKDQEI